ncbi:hypothetical protein [Magnetospirillum sp. SS-4]|uniref:hypothetical protein n=1 Tax=Magnetospirillum sp. SS-4 TaxID=2681465 RepID=UPI00137F05C1|nr:hypothetical protein [Magnetospirillum sp. SS-4]CAA7616577.1 conserved hypothetical protein [Magnetospirillum sp. SS-4]
MTLRTEHCNFRLVSDTGRALLEAGDPKALVDFTRKTLACPRMSVCPFGDYCTILSASLLSEHGKQHGHDCIEG